MIAQERSWGISLAAVISNSSMAVAAWMVQADPACPAFWRGLLGTCI